MKKNLLLVTLIMMGIILSLWADEPEKKGTSQKDIGQEESIYCNAAVPAEGQAGTPVQFQAMASKGKNAGDLAAIDNIVGTMRFVPATGPEGFLQGSPTSEPGRYAHEAQFTHILTRNIAVMETEVTRQMWADLKAVQPSLCGDPTLASHSQGMDNPVLNITSNKMYLFANLLSIKNGLVPCYYTDSTKTVLIDSSNFATDNVIFCDFSANGYRLPTEGEWEYFARAGTTTPFSIDEPNYNTANYKSCDTSVLSQLAKVARYCATKTSSTGKNGLPNPWNLKDIHGNAAETCWDGFGEYPTGTVTDYQVPGNWKSLVHRGGGFNFEPFQCRSAYRYTNPSNSYSIGFRLVRTL